MPPVVLIAAAALGVVLVLRSRAAAASAAGLPRVYTKADGPAFHELLLVKANLGRSLRTCIAQERARRPSAIDVYIGTLAGAAGLVTGAVTLSPDKGIAVFRSAMNGYQSVRTKDSPCAAQFDQLGRDIARHDELCAQLGFGPEVTYEEVQRAYATIGGENYDAVTSNARGEQFSTADLDAWDRDIRRTNLQYMLKIRKLNNGGRGIPPYNPNSSPPGLALRS